MSIEQQTLAAIREVAASLKDITARQDTAIKLLEQIARKPKAAPDAPPKPRSRKAR